MQMPTLTRREWAIVAAPATVIVAIALITLTCVLCRSSSPPEPEAELPPAAPVAAALRTPELTWAKILKTPLADVHNNDWPTAKAKMRAASETLITVDRSHEMRMMAATVLLLSEDFQPTIAFGTVEELVHAIVHGEHKLEKDVGASRIAIKTGVARSFISVNSEAPDDAHAIGLELLSELEPFIGADDVKKVPLKIKQRFRERQETGYWDTADYLWSVSGSITQNFFLLEWRTK
jgi:hypothetical protein